MHPKQLNVGKVFNLSMSDQDKILPSWANKLLALLYRLTPTQTCK